METNQQQAATASQRLVSLDAYRGIVMFVLAGTGFGLAQAAEKMPLNGFMQFLKFHTTHPDWNSQVGIVGFSLWDMIQPAFMFIVGVSLPYSNAKRVQRGDAFGKRLGHVLIRAATLVLLGVFLSSLWKSETNWIFTNVLCQIGLGYGFLFLLAGRSFRLQAVIGVSLLLLYWILLLIFPLDAASGTAHFSNGSSMPQQVDIWFLNLFPRSKVFIGNAYATLNFVPSLVTMLLGLMSGQLLMNEQISADKKVRRLLAGGLFCLVLGVTWSFLGCPIVKKLWTPSWTLFSGAFVIWLLALLYLIVDIRGWKRWTFPFVVVGMNPITMYFMSMTMRPWVRDALKRHLPDALFAHPFGSVVEACLVLLVFWLIVYWMYRKRVFIRI
jgi:predicted acyltransferase